MMLEDQRGDDDDSRESHAGERNEINEIKRSEYAGQEEMLDHDLSIGS